MVFNDLYASNLLKASGAHVLNGVQYVPNLKTFNVLDPEGRYATIWNRFSHFGVIRSEDYSIAAFSLPAVDSIVLSIHACSSLLEQLDVKYFVFRSPATESEISCLKPVEEALPPGFWIYERR